MPAQNFLERQWIIFLGIFLISMSLAGLSAASPITRTFIFSASGFDPDAAFDPVNGSVTITFDPTAGDVSDQTNGIDLNSLNIMFGSPPPVIAFNYIALTDVLFVGGIPEGNTMMNGVAGQQDDWQLAILSPSYQAPTLGSFFYSTANLPVTVHAATNRSLSIMPQPGMTLVPEPGTLALFGLGIAGLAATRRRRRCAA